MIKIVSISSYLSKTGINVFDSGDENLNTYLKKYAGQNELRGFGRTFLLVDQFLIIGFYTLSTTDVDWLSLPNEEKKKLPKSPVPCLRIARFAVDRKYQGKGYGKIMMRDIFIKTLAVASVAGVYALIVEPKEKAISYYTQFGFVKLANVGSYALPVATLKKLIGEK